MNEKHSFIDQVIAILGLEKNIVLDWANKAPKAYKRYSVDKRNGSGKRIIHHPAKQTKAIQYALLAILEPLYIAPQCVFGYVKGLESPLRKNAELHANNAFLIRIDFSDFFPSIRPEDLFLALEDKKGNFQILLSQDDKIFLQNCLFAKFGAQVFGLPIGAPSSPLISNIVMEKIDRKLAEHAEKKGFKYSRYADDLIFSTDTKKSSKAFNSSIEKLLSKFATPKLTVNEKKTRFMARNHRRVITGLFITPGGDISIGRQKKRYIRKLLLELKHNKLELSSKLILQGYLAYILDVEPSFHSRLCLKYGADLLKKALTSPATA